MGYGTMHGSTVVSGAARNKFLRHSAIAANG
jgi:hypothetical protein